MSSPNPTTPPSPSPSNPAAARPGASGVRLGIWLNRAALVVSVLVLLIVSGYGCYALGYHYGYNRPVTSDTQALETGQLSVPLGATIIQQCALGRGIQYILPGNIPHGPVYSVYQGEVVGLEYMIGKAELATNTGFSDLPLYGKIYNHLDIGLQSAGHAGFPAPHYHIDVHTNTTASSNAITCK